MEIDLPWSKASSCGKGSLKWRRGRTHAKAHGRTVYGVKGVSIIRDNISPPCRPRNASKPVGQCPPLIPVFPFTVRPLLYTKEVQSKESIVTYVYLFQENFLLPFLRFFV